MIEITQPLFLILLSIIPLLWLPLRNSIADLTPRQRRACVAVRALILTLLVLALVGVRLRLPSHALAVIYVVDHSQSVSAPAAEQALQFVNESAVNARMTDSTGTIAFAADAVVWPFTSARAVEPPPLKDRAATDLGHAIAFASAAFPAEKAKRIVLLSDGLDTGGKAVEAAAQASEAGIEIYAVPLRNPQEPEVLVESVAAPRQLKSGEAFDLSAAIRSNVKTGGVVRLYQNQFLIKQMAVQLQRGPNAVTFENLSSESSLTTYEVEVVPEADSVLENNRVQTVVSALGKPRVLLVDPEEQRVQALANALRADQIDVEVRSAKGLPQTPEDLQQFDLFILSDVSALQLSRDQMELYSRWVQEFGGAFLMAGGENSFGAGGYPRTPIEQMLPVRMEHDDRVETPTVALLVVLDRSGSMSARVHGRTKMSLANEGAVQAMQVLQPKDLFGVLAVDTRAHVVAPLQRLDATPAVEKRIMSIVAGGGGIYVYTSMLEAFQQLRDAEAKIKHVIVFSDAADAEEKRAGATTGALSGSSSLDLATAMLGNNITTSVVALGFEHDKDTEFLRQLAERGNGRFYLTNDAINLPQIFTTETIKVAQSSLVEEPFVAQPVMRSPMISGIDWSGAPLLLGYNATKSKPTADVLLASERAEPLLVTWRYGLGQAAAFTSDTKGRWTSEWMSWPGFGKFWTQIVRGLMRSSERSGLHVSTIESGDELEISADAVALDGSFRNDLKLTATQRDPSGESQTQQLSLEAPGRYTASFRAPENGTAIFSVTSGENEPRLESVFGFTRSYPKEFLGIETDEELLRRISQISNGKFAPSPADIFQRRAAAASILDLSDYFLTLSLLLFPVDIWLRRRTWNS